MGDEDGAELADAEDGAVAVRGAGRRGGQGWRGTAGGVRTGIIREAGCAPAPSAKPGRTGIIREAGVRTGIIREAGSAPGSSAKPESAPASARPGSAPTASAVARCASTAASAAGLVATGCAPPASTVARTCTDLVHTAGCRNRRARADGFGTRGTAGPRVRGHVRAAGCGGRRERGTTHGRSLPTLCARP